MKKMNRQRRRKQQRIEANVESCEVLFAAEGFVKVEASGDGAPSVAVLAYTGGLLSLQNFPNPVVVNTAGVKAQSEAQLPLLRDHNQSRVVGHGKPIIESKQLRIEGKLSVSGPERDSLIEASNGGFSWQASIGGRIPNPRKDIYTVPAGKSVSVNGRQFSGPIHVVNAFHWKETSIVALGADEGRASASIAAMFNPGVQRKKPMNEFEKWLEASGFNSDELSATQLTELKAMFDKTQTPKTDDSVDLNKVTEAAVKAALEASRTETQRQARIDRLFASYTDTSLSRDEFVALRSKVEAGEMSEDSAHLALLQASRATGGTRNVGGSSRDNDALVLEAAVARTSGLDEKHIEEMLVKAGAGAEQVDRAMNESASSRYAGKGIRALIAAACRQAGHSYDTIGDDEIRCALEQSADLMRQGRIDAASGFSTVSLPGILGRLANKAMLAAYAEADASGAALQVASVTSTSDFKKFSRYRMTESGVMEKVGATGEIKHGTLKEETYENQVETYGKMLSLSRQMMRNDDLDAFLQIPRMIGRQGRHALEQAVIVTLVDAPVAAGAGTTEFFHGAKRGTQEPNYAAGAATALSIDSLGTAYQLFLNQVDADGKPIMIDPAILLVTTANIVTATKLYNDTEFRFTVADTTETVQNQWKGMFRPVKSSYLHRLGASPSSTHWFLCANPTTDVAGIQVAFLDGRREPIIEQAQLDFSVLGIQWRGYFDFGVALQDPRAIVKVKGAA